MIYQASRKKIERVMGIEPTYPAWKAGVLPLNYTRMFIYEAEMCIRDRVGDVTRQELTQVAASLLGHPYLMGGKSPSQGSPKGPLDCSGFRCV